MSTIRPVPPGYPKEIIGYAQPWIVDPGEVVEVKVSCTEPQYKYRTMRILQGYDGPQSPPKQFEEVVGIPQGACGGRFQVANSGSYAFVSDIGVESTDNGLLLDLYVQPWLITEDHEQTIASTLSPSVNTGFALLLDRKGLLEVKIGTGDAIEVVSSGFTPQLKRWLHVVLCITTDQVHLELRPVAQTVEPAGSAQTVQRRTDKPMRLTNTMDLTLAASYGGVPSDACDKFNGRLDAVILSACGGEERILTHFDFAQDMSTDRIVDISGFGRHGELVNAPTRALKGHDWDGTETNWSEAKRGYGALHFHEDDLDDACWDTDFTINIPVDARSGVYGVEIQSVDGDVSETVVLYVRPTALTTAKLQARAAIVMSTFTYLAYTNEHMFDPNSPARVEIPDEFGSFEFFKDETFYKQERRTDLGLSHYDVHRDGSGVVFSSAKRPMLNNRPDYVNWTGHRPRELSAELIMVGFMERLGIAYDVITDHDLHMKGVSMLAPYSVLITGCHPEYPTIESYTAYEQFVKSGGNLMYLGGNGFYWSSAMDASRPHRLEVRRGGQGVRTSFQQPGERHFSLTGKEGGLWRDKGKAANYLVGIGCCGEGAGPGVPYMASATVSNTHSELAAWVFAGLSGSELIGTDTLGGFGGGASADEIDRVDHAYGSPANVIVLASSTGHSDRFGLFPEDSGFPMQHTLGSQTSMIRSDMVYFDTSGGGAVFSVGSISWYVGLGWQNYDNSAAVVTGNVLREFLTRGRKGRGGITGVASSKARLSKM
ncbi:hypothetical protein LTR85_001481 [Meristemomyces frigidus]|nr:hypothetical protein LTR85_001481 [Meristemomyces frigidus]